MLSSEESQSADALLAEDHEALAKLLSEVVAALDKRDAPVAFARLDLFWARLAMHIRGENLHLFPAILRALDGDAAKRADQPPAIAEAREAIAQLRCDHDFFMHELAGAINYMREGRTTAAGDSTREIDSVRQVIGTLRNRLEGHNKLEENLVYRLPAKLLEPGEQGALGEHIRDELKNLPQRFRDEEG